MRVAALRAQLRERADVDGLGRRLLQDGFCSVSTIPLLTAPLPTPSQSQETALRQVSMSPSLRDHWPHLTWRINYLLAILQVLLTGFCDCVAKRAPAAWFQSVQSCDEQGNGVGRRGTDGGAPVGRLGRRKRLTGAGDRTLSSDAAHGFSVTF